MKRILLADNAHLTFWAIRGAIVFMVHDQDNDRAAVHFKPTEAQLLVDLLLPLIAEANRV